MVKPSAILMGAKPGAAVALEILLGRGWNVQRVVVTRRPEPSWLPTPHLGEAADAAGVQVCTQPELPLDEPVDFVISYMYRNLVKAPTLALARRAALNFHAGPLPEFGGWAFYNVAILEDSPEYGCTCHHMDEGFDSGPLLEVRRFPIVARQETAYSLERKAQAEMIRLFVDFCELAESGAELPKIPQAPGALRYLNAKEFAALKRIPEHADADTIERYARAFWFPPYECAYAEIDGHKVQVIPELAKEELATLLHADDLEALRLVAHGYAKSTGS